MFHHHCVQCSNSPIVSCGKQLSMSVCLYTSLYTCLSTKLYSISEYNRYPCADPLADVFGPAARSFVEYLQLFLLVPGHPQPHHIGLRD